MRDFARTAAREIAGARWSYCRDFGRTRLVVVDSRAGRVLAEGRRQMLSDAEWDWVEDRCTGDFDHLVVGTSLPFMLAPGMHHLEAWNEAVCDGAWGRLAARAGEKIRQALDLEHWAAFQGCFARLSVLLEDVAAGRRGPAPATITLLSGDVHHAYLAEAWFPGRPVTSRVLQVTCSPVRNPLDKRERRALRSAFTRPVAAFARRVARAAGVPTRRRYAGPSPRRPPSTTRSRAWTSAGATRSCASRRRCRRTGGRRACTRACRSASRRRLARSPRTPRGFSGT